MSLILSGDNGVSDIDGSASTPAIRGTDANTGIFFPAADTIAFSEGGAEAMRIDSSGRLVVGTTAAADANSILTLYNPNATSAQIFIQNTTTGTGLNGSRILANGNDLYITNKENGVIVFETNDTERMRIDSSGNVGIAVTPSAWGSGWRGVQFGASGAAISGNYSAIGVHITGNTYFDGTNWKYLADGLVTDYYQNAGIHAWRSADTGTAGNNVTWTERARITSGGYFKASNNGSYVGSTGTYHEFTQTANSVCMWVATTNASYTDAGMDIRAERSATSSYKFLLCESSNGADLEFNLRGDGNGYADGTWNNNGADYAEFFESANGQALTLGATVVLDGTKVREATAQDDPKNIIGVVRPKEPSKASMVVGNTAWNKWANKYLTDDFDRYIMEDHDVVEWEEQVLEKEAVAAVEAVVDEEGNEVSAAIPAQEAVYKTVQHSYESHNIPAGITVPANAVRKTHDDKGNKFQHYKLNPAWDKDAEYTPREKRPEWNIIGLLGQVKILKGQPVGDRWVKMRDVSSAVEEWMIR